MDAPQGRPAGPVGGGSVAAHRAERRGQVRPGEATQWPTRCRHRHDAAVLERQAGRRGGRVPQVRRDFPRPRRARRDSLGLQVRRRPAQGRASVLSRDVRYAARRYAARGQGQARERPQRREHLQVHLPELLHPRQAGLGRVLETLARSHAALVPALVLQRDATLLAGGVIWGVNVRVAFLDDFPVGRNAYYLLCFVLGIVMLRAPQYASRIAFAESTANLGLLILSVAVWYLRMLDWAAGPSVAVRVVTPAELVHFVLTAVVAGVSYGVRGSATPA